MQMSLSDTMEINHPGQAQILFSWTHKSISNTHPTHRYDYQTEGLFLDISQNII
jgi:hypothetical protein